MQLGERICAITASSQVSHTCDCRTNRKSLVNMVVMATSTYGDVCPDPRRVGMVLGDLSVQEIRIPPKTVIGNVQTAEIIPHTKVLEHTGEILLQRSKRKCHRSASLTAQNPPQRVDLANPNISAIGARNCNLRKQFAGKGGSIRVCQMKP